MPALNLLKCPQVGLVSPRIQAILSVCTSDLAALVGGNCSLDHILMVLDAT